MFHKQHTACTISFSLSLVRHLSMEMEWAPKKWPNDGRAHVRHDKYVQATIINKRLLVISTLFCGQAKEFGIEVYRT